MSFFWTKAHVKGYISLGLFFFPLYTERKRISYIYTSLHVGPWIQIQSYKMMGKAEFNQQKPFF